MSDPRDRALERASAGERDAFEVVVRTFWDLLMRFFWARVDRNQAEELTQQVFVSVWRATQRGRGPREGTSEAWRRYLLTSARHGFTSHLRRRGRQTAAMPSFDVLGDAYAAPEDDVVRPPLEDTERRAIRDCLDTLGPTPRTLVWLVFVDGQSKRQAGRFLELPEATVRTTLAAALKQMSVCLKGKGVDG